MTFYILYYIKDAAFGGLFSAIVAVAMEVTNEGRSFFQVYSVQTRIPELENKQKTV